jgi:hypothetical protein
VKTIEIPPARSIRNEVKDSIWRPFRLKNGLLQSPGNPGGISQRAVLPDSSRPKFGSIPRHIRMVPREPSQTIPLAIDPRRCIEIIARNQNLTAVGLI